jgi:hypothetical protein
MLKQDSLVLSYSFQQNIPNFSQKEIQLQFMMYR